ncbi:MAG TPA: hypothetical protein DEG69_08640 [Flavobacteriaceae bacterium]|nr:hypothetical protein [Flavobacteriaceae bacterium]
MAAVTSAVVGVASGVLGATQSFKQAADAKSAQAKAAGESKKLMAEAKLMAEKNYFEGLNVPMGAYERQREENLVAGQQAISALQEGDQRGLAGGVGQVNQAQTVASEGLRNDLGQALYDNEKMKAEERKSINQDLIAANVGEAKDLRAEADYQAKAGKQASMSGVQSALGAVGSAASLVPLYGKNRAAKRADSLYEANAQAFKDKGIGTSRAKNLLLNLDNKKLKQLTSEGATFDFDTIFGKAYTNKQGQNYYSGESGFVSSSDD